jgi:hypothetical protein
MSPSKGWLIRTEGSFTSAAACNAFSEWWISRKFTHYLEWHKDYHLEYGAGCMAGRECSSCRLVRFKRALNSAQALQGSSRIIEMKKSKCGAPGVHMTVGSARNCTLPRRDKSPQIEDGSRVRRSNALNQRPALVWKTVPTACTRRGNST